MSWYNLISFSGIFLLIGVAWLLSTNRKNFNWRVVCWGLTLQFAFAALLFCTPFSRKIFLTVSNVFNEALGSAQAGTQLLFGGLYSMKTNGFVLAIHALPLVVVFASIMSLLYYYRIMQKIIQGFSWVFFKLMRISGAESLCTATTIFVGIESSTTVRPFLSKMTRSELCMILSAGMATIATTVLAAYTGMLKSVIPSISGHLISASLISAPAAIIMSKILLPEDGQPVTLGKFVKVDIERENNAMEAIVSGAMYGMKLLMGIVALLLALLGIIGILNFGLGAMGDCFGMDWSIQKGLGYLFYPFALIIGIPKSDAMWAAKLLGERLIMTEIPAYQTLAKNLSDPNFQFSQRTPVILSYALCGFAHFASLGIFVGGISALVPERRKDLSDIGLRALLAANLACLMTGAVAGTFFNASQTIFAVK